VAAPQTLNPGPGAVTEPSIPWKRTPMTEPVQFPQQPLKGSIPPRPLANYRQSTGLRTRWMVDRFKAREAALQAGLPVPAWGRRGVLMDLATDVSGPGVDAWRAQHPEHRTWNGKDLAFVPTVFDRLDPQLCRLLVYRGWWLTGATFARYHPGLVVLPTDAPRV